MNARKISILFFSAVAAALLAASALRLPVDWRLAGVEAPVARPPLSARAWLSGEFAAAFEPWAARKFAFRGFAIRVAHQLEWFFFRTLPVSGGTAIDIGHDHWLYEHEYIRHYVRRYGMLQEDADEFASRLAALRGRLAKRGVPLVVCLSPSKPAVYPEYLLDRDRPPQKHMDRVPARDTLAAALAEAGIPLVDCTAILTKWRAEGAPALFSRNGTHWNAYAAQRVLAEIWRLAVRDAPALPALPPLVGYVSKEPLPSDNDLCSLYNMVRYPFLEATQPYPLLDAAGAAPGGRRVRVLGVGDSFSFQLADAMGRTGLVSQFRLLYYNKAEYLFAWQEGERPEVNDAVKARLRELPPDGADLEAMFADCDLVVVELNDVYAKQRAWGFAD